MIPYYKYEQTPLTPDQSHLLLALITGPQRAADKEEMLTDVADVPTGGALVKRTEALGVRVAAPVYLYLTLACIRSMGEMSLYAHALQCIYELEKTEVTMEVLIKYFGLGFPDASACEKAWVAQKLPDGSNEVDRITLSTL